MHVSENGDFLALDLGGTNFRVLLCRMRDGHCESTSRNYNVPNHKLHGPAAAVRLRQTLSLVLFDLSFIALTLSAGQHVGHLWLQQRSPKFPSLGDH